MTVCMALQALLRNECGVELALAVPPAQLATSAWWTLRGASAFVAGKLGTSVSAVLQQHSMLHMTKVSHAGLYECCQMLQVHHALVYKLWHCMMCQHLYSPLLKLSLYRLKQECTVIIWRSSGSLCVVFLYLALLC